jgi:hypothetical protein
MIRTFCIAHRHPTVSKHLYDVVIDTPSKPNYQQLVSVVAHRELLKQAPDELVNVCGYRKIMMRGTATHQTIRPADCEMITRSTVEPAVGREFLLCLHNFVKLGGRGNIKVQWGMAHLMPDFEAARDLAIEMELMTRDEWRQLEEEPALIEGGCSMGIMPGTLLKEIMGKVIPFYDEFAARHHQRFLKYDPVQRRVIPFLAERIETHFILRELRARYPAGIPSDIFGCLTSVWSGPWEAGRI